MKTYDIWIPEVFADAIMEGNRFLIHENDRAYQKGDELRLYVGGGCSDHPIDGDLADITFVVSGWGLKSGYVLLGIAEHRRDPEMETDIGMKEEE